MGPGSSTYDSFSRLRPFRQASDWWILAGFGTARTLEGMLTWLLWNKMKVLVALLVLSLIGGGVYAFSTVNTAQEGTRSAATLDGIFGCETPECVETELVKVPKEKLIELLAEVNRTDKGMARQPAGLREVGGLCSIAGRSMGQMLAEGEDVAGLGAYVAGIDMTPSPAGERLGYPCQFGLVYGLVETIAAKASLDEIREALPGLCEDPARTGDEVRHRFSPVDGLCSFAVTGALVASEVLAGAEEPRWSAVVELCNAVGETQVSQCLQGALGTVRMLKYVTTFEPTDCKVSLQPGYCNIILSEARGVLQLAELVASSDLESNIDDFCKGATDMDGCRQGLYLSLWSFQGYRACDLFGSRSDECLDVAFTRDAFVRTIFSTAKGDLLVEAICTAESARERCEDIVAGIANYQFVSGLV
jgi:hypothetical protein